MKLLPFSRLLAVSSILALFAVLPASAKPRTFTDQKGRKIEAEIISVAGTKVTLRLTNGKNYTIPIKSLSENDQFFVKVWSTEEKSGAKKSGDPDKTTPTIPDNIKYRIEIEADKERIKKGSKGKVSSGEIQTDQWVYETNLENKSRVKLEGLEMSYRVYVDPIASVKVTMDSPPKFYGGRQKVSSVEDGATVMVRTGPVPLTELELDPGFVFRDGSRNDLEDKLEGIWIKVWHGDKKVAEFKSNNSTVKKAKWADNETADPDAEPDEEKAPAQKQAPDMEDDAKE
ncbi:SHD1 domain-containing protein [Akkermansiaceae bacterium]|jgi:hypothetical protein|nr:SHD1 domain-containing protein [Akkermansiaceae bacterium]